MYTENSKHSLDNIKKSIESEYELMKLQSAKEHIKANGICAGIKNSSGIYAITIDDYVVYIGQAKNLESRTRGHIRHIINGHKRNKYVLLNSARLLGHKINCCVVEECDAGRLNDLETTYINKYCPPLNSKKSLIGVASDLTLDDLLEKLEQCQRV